jgi:hypothetical protein
MTMVLVHSRQGRSPQHRHSELNSSRPVASHHRRSRLEATRKLGIQVPLQGIRVTEAVAHGILVSMFIRGPGMYAMRCDVCVAIS